MERFNWTPSEIGEIPLGKLQRIFVTMEQRDISKAYMAEQEQKKQQKQQKSNRR